MTSEFAYPRTFAMRASSIALGLLTALAPCLPAAAADSAVVRVTRPQQSLTLGLDKSKVIDLPADAHDILVANPLVADAVTRTQRRLYIFGKSVGQTNIFVFDKNGREMAVLDRFIALRCSEDVRSYQTELHLDLDHFKDLFELEQVSLPDSATRYNPGITLHPNSRKPELKT